MKSWQLFGIAVVLLTQAASATPTRLFVPNDLEKSMEDEKETTQFLVNKMKDLAGLVRDQHPKPFGCIDGAYLTVDWENPTFTLPNGTEQKLNVGIFEDKGTVFPVKLRLSSGSPSIFALDPDGGALGMAAMIDIRKLKNGGIHRAYRYDGETNNFYFGTYGIKDYYSKLLDPEIFYLNQSWPLISAGTDDNKGVEWDDPKSEYVRNFFADNGKDYVDFLNFQEQNGKAAEAIIKDLMAKDPNIAKQVATLKNPMKVPQIKAAIGAKALELMTKLYILKRGVFTPTIAEVFQKINGTKTKDPLNKEYNSFLPFHYGKDAKGNVQMVKIAYRRSKGEYKNPKDIAIPPGIDVKSDNYISDWLRYDLQNRTTNYDVLVQFYVRNPAHDPSGKLGKADNKWPAFESTTAEWPSTAEANKEYSPFVKVATLTIPQTKNEKGKEFMDPTVCETLNMNPGHSLPEHYPATSTQRVRIPIYIVDSSVRNQKREAAAALKAAHAFLPENPFAN